jgi:hypothetical protein
VVGEGSPEPRPWGPEQRANTITCESGDVSLQVGKLLRLRLLHFQALANGAQHRHHASDFVLGEQTDLQVEFRSFLRGCGHLVLIHQHEGGQEYCFHRREHREYHESRIERREGQRKLKKDRVESTPEAPINRGYHELVSPLRQ